MLIVMRPTECDSTKLYKNAISQLLLAIAAQIGR